MNKDGSTVVLNIGQPIWYTDRQLGAPVACAGIIGAIDETRVSLAVTAWRGDGFRLVTISYPKEGDRGMTDAAPGTEEAIGGWSFRT